MPMKHFKPIIKSVLIYRMALSGGKKVSRMSKRRNISDLLGLNLVGVLNEEMKCEHLHSVAADPAPTDNRCAILVFMLHHVMIERN
jgi:hypothetical protein